MPTKEFIQEINSRRKPNKGFSEESLRHSGEKAIVTIQRNKFAAKLNLREYYGNNKWSNPSFTYYSAGNCSTTNDGAKLKAAE